MIIVIKGYLGFTPQKMQGRYEKSDSCINFGFYFILSTFPFVNVHSFLHLRPTKHPWDILSLKAEYKTPFLHERF